MVPALYVLPFLAVLVILLIGAEFAHKRLLIYVWKPVSSLALPTAAGLALLLPGAHASYTLWILIGLLFCFGGDMALMFQENPKAFRLGLVLFLIGHLVYTGLFLQSASLSPAVVAATAALALLGFGIYRLMSPNLGGMRLPVLFYIVVISLMVAAAFAAARSGTFSRVRSRLILAGALLFYISDLILAANRFWRPFRYHRISLAFYFSGQFCLALSASY